MTIEHNDNSKSPSSAVMTTTGVDALPFPSLVVANTEHSYTVNGVKPEASQYGNYHCLII